jgi:hypothetical protein
MEGQEMLAATAVQRTLFDGPKQKINLFKLQKCIK